METVHKPVLLNEVLKNINPQAGQNFIDCTYGGGGHSQEILKKIKPDGKLLAIDANQDVDCWSPRCHIGTDQKNSFKLVIDNFKNLKKIVDKNSDFFNRPKGRENFINGILLDLGLSSDELEQSGRGFSFQQDEPLDMRFDINQDLTAAKILNTYSFEDLYDVFKNLGEYPHARRLSQSVLEQRKLKEFKTTQDLVDLILKINPRKHYHRLHPATKVFQALRIAVNSELESLEKVLPQAIEILTSGGRLAIISFHALEDRIIKHYFRNLSRQENSPIKLLTKKPITPTDEEIKNNPRSRSAKLRVIEKI